MDAETDAAIANAYPRRWAWANGKQRNRLRKRWREDLLMNELRAAGKKCANCNSWSKGTCDRHSDWNTKSPTKADYLCHEWTERKP